MAGVRRIRSEEEERQTRSSTSNISNTSKPDLDLEEETCPICLETLARKIKGGRAVRSSFTPSKELGGVVILDCGHGFCKDCLVQYVRIAIREGRTRMGTLLCPVSKCKVSMQQGLLKNLASAAD